MDKTVCPACGSWLADPLIVEVDRLGRSLVEARTDIARLRAENDALRAALQAALREQREVVVAAPREER